MDIFRLNFVGVGPQRTGTSWLYQLLQYHPSICFPKGVKETMFFDQHYEKSLKWYRAHFVHRKAGQICGEVAPTYFDEAIAAQRIHQLDPNCKIIINLRNPVHRARSLYHLHLTRGRTRDSFSEAIKQMPRIIDSGRYAQHIPRWLDMFGAEQVTIILLDDIKTQPSEVLKEIYSFLVIDEIPMPDLGHKKIATMTMPRSLWLSNVAVRLSNWLHSKRLHKLVALGKRLGLNAFIFTGGGLPLPGLTSKQKKQLLKMYEPDIAFVEDLLSCDLSIWRETV